MGFGKSFVILGSGNVGWHLSLALKRKGYRPLQVYSPTAANARKLAARLNCGYTTNTARVVPDASWYLIAVSDNAIARVAAARPLRNKRLVHTAAGVPLDVLSEFTASCGVLYPLQTFSKSREISFSDIPLFIEGSDNQTTIALGKMAATLSLQVRSSTYRQRIALHVAAVFCCNFVNHFIARAKEVVKKEKISFNVFKPLLNETIYKALKYNPIDIQTGPARRGDSNTIKRHLSYLKDDPDSAKLYRFVSSSIFDYYSNK